MFDQSARAVNGRAFFVAGDNQADRTRFRRNVVQRRDEGGDAAFHIDRAAPVQKVAAYFRHEGLAAPALAGRNDIDVAGKGEMATFAFADSKQILDRSAMRRVDVAFARNEALDSKTKRHQHGLNRIEHRARRGRNALASDQLLCIFKGKAVGHST